MKLTRTQASRGLDTGSAISIDTATAANAIGGGIQRLGAAITSVEERLQQNQRNYDTYQAEIGYIGFVSDAETAFNESLQQDDVAAPGFASGAVSSFDAASAQFQRTLPDYLKDEYKVKLEGTRATIRSNAATQEVFARNSMYVTSVNDVGRMAEMSLLDDPGNIDVALNQVVSFIAKTGLPVAKKKELAVLWRDTLIDRHMQTRLATDPESLQRSLGAGPITEPIFSTLGDDAVSSISQGALNSGVDPLFMATTAVIEGGPSIQRAATIDVDPSAVYTDKTLKSKFYSAETFRSKDGAPLKINAKTVAQLDYMTELLGGQPLSITSSHRSATHNAAVGGADASQHLAGPGGAKAFDITLPEDPQKRRDILKAAIAAGFTGIGFYADKPNTLHVDTRDQLTTWFSGGQGQRAPNWASDLIDKAYRSASSRSQGTENDYPFQIDEKTWIKFLDKHGAKYGLNTAGMTRAEKLAVRGDVDIASALMGNITAENEFVMTKTMGRTPSPGELYIGHLVGGTTAGMLVKALESGKGGESAAVLFPVESKQFKSVFFDEQGQAKSVIDIYESLTTKFSIAAEGTPRTEDTTIDPMYSELDATTVDKYRVLAATAVNDLSDQRSAERTRAQAIEAAAYKARVTDIETRIIEDRTYGRAQLVQENLAGDDYNKMLTMINARKEDDTAMANALARFDGPNSSYSVFNSDDRKEIDKLYGLADPTGEGLRAQDPKAIAFATQLTAKSGIVPATASSSIAVMAVNGDENAVTYAMKLATSLRSEGSDVFREANGKEVIETKLAEWEVLTKDLSMSDAEAAKEMVKRRDPEYKKVSGLLSDNLSTFLKDLSPKDLSAGLDPKGFDLGRMLGGQTTAATTIMQEAIMDDYRSYASKAFRDQAAGDPDVAKKLAIQEMRKTYGVSRVSGHDVLMKYPPEKFFAAPGGRMEYFSEQAINLITKETGYKVDPADLVVVVLPQTQSQIEQNQKPSYGLQYFHEEKGIKVMETFPYAFTPDEQFAKDEWSRVLQDKLAIQQERMDMFRITKAVSGPDWDYKINNNAEYQARIKKLKKLEDAQPNWIPPSERPDADTKKQINNADEYTLSDFENDVRRVGDPYASDGIFSNFDSVTGLWKGAPEVQTFEDNL